MLYLQLLQLYNYFDQDEKLEGFLSFRKSYQKLKSSF